MLQEPNYPLLLVDGLLVFDDAAELPVLDRMAIFSGRLPSSEAWFALEGLFQ
jgi:hypothetical protein